jgi:antitoxin MazE
MHTRASIIRIGNSRGVRIPKPLLEQAGLSGAVQLHAEKGRVVIQPDREPRQGWKEAFASAAGQYKKDALPGEITNVFDGNEWTW